VRVPFRRERLALTIVCRLIPPPRIAARETDSALLNNSFIRIEEVQEAERIAAQ
jgi:hypothetical protein